MSSRLTEREAMQLLPGIVDEMTLDHICTKLPWRTFHVLSSVNSLWRDAIQRRLVYDTRVRCNSTEILALIEYDSPANPRVKKQGDDTSGSLALIDYSMTGHFTTDHFMIHHSRSPSKLALYSMRDDICYQLPRNPHIVDAYHQCSYVALNGKIYCMAYWEADNAPFSDLYMLDLAGQRQWERCQSMIVPRSKFGWGVVDGMIYVAGGSFMTGENPAIGSEVYDPKENVWASISDMKTSRYGHHITTLGGEMFAYGGLFFPDNPRERRAQQLENGAIAGGLLRKLFEIQNACFLEVYNSDSDKWRKVEPFGLPAPRRSRLFLAQGKLHLFSSGRIHVLDGTVESNTWREIHSFSLSDAMDFGKMAVLEVDGELLIVCHSKGERGLSLLRSTGFGSSSKELVWKTANCPLVFEPYSSLTAIQL